MFSSAPAAVCDFNFNYLSGDVKSYCNFILIFLMTNDSASLYNPCRHPRCFSFEETSIRILWKVFSIPQYNYSVYCSLKGFLKHLVYGAMPLVKITESKSLLEKENCSVK